MSLDIKLSQKRDTRRNMRLSIIMAAFRLPCRYAYPEVPLSCTDSREASVDVVDNGNNHLNMSNGGCGDDYLDCGLTAQRSITVRNEGA